MNFRDFKAMLVRLCPANVNKLAYPRTSGKHGLAEIMYNTAIYCEVNKTPDGPDLKALRNQIKFYDATKKFLLLKD